MPSFRIISNNFCISYFQCLSSRHKRKHCNAPWDRLLLQGGLSHLRNSSGPLVDRYSRSYPAQNVSPFPYNTATELSSSISKCLNASASSFAVSASTALRFSGRAIDTRKISPSCSVSTRLLLNLLAAAIREGILSARCRRSVSVIFLIKPRNPE